MPFREQFSTDEAFLKALRDWFAGLTLQGTLASWSEHDEKAFAHESVPDRMRSFAELSYQQADAMLAERSKP